MLRGVRLHVCEQLTHKDAYSDLYAAIRLVRLVVAVDIRGDGRDGE